MLHAHARTAHHDRVVDRQVCVGAHRLSCDQGPVAVTQERLVHAAVAMVGFLDALQEVAQRLLRLVGPLGLRRLGHDALRRVVTEPHDRCRLAGAVDGFRLRLEKLGPIDVSVDGPQLGKRPGHVRHHVVGSVWISDGDDGAPHVVAVESEQIGAIALARVAVETLLDVVHALGAVLELLLLLVPLLPLLGRDHRALHLATRHGVDVGLVLLRFLLEPGVVFHLLGGALFREHDAVCVVAYVGGKTVERSDTRGVHGDVGCALLLGEAVPPVGVVLGPVVLGWWLDRVEVGIGRLAHAPRVRRDVRPVPGRHRQVVIGLEGLYFRRPLRVRVRGFLERVGDPVRVPRRLAVVRVRVDVRRLALQGIGGRTASGTPRHRAAIGDLLVARLLTRRIRDRAVPVHRTAVRLGVIDRRVQLPLGGRHVVGEPVEGRADHAAFGQGVVEVLRQGSKLLLCRLRCLTLQRLTHACCDGVLDVVLG